MEKKMNNGIALKESFWETKTGHVIRWLGVLPCSILGAAIVVLFMFALCLIGDLLDGSFWIYLKEPQIIFYEHFFTPFVLSAALGGSFVYIGVSVSPVHKKAVSLVLALLIACIFGFIGIIALIAHEWRGVVQTVITIASAGIVAFYAPNDID